MLQVPGAVRIQIPPAGGRRAANPGNGIAVEPLCNPLRGWSRSGRCGRHLVRLIVTSRYGSSSGHSAGTSSRRMVGIFGGTESLIHRQQIDENRQSGQTWLTGNRFGNAP